MSLQRIRVVRLLDKEYTTILSAPKQLLCMNGCRSHRRQYARAVATRQCIRYTINLGRYYPHSRCLETSRSISSAQHVQPKQVGGSSSFVIPTESKLENNPDIFVDDLEATLEAHRATNKAKIIRHIPVPPDPAVKHITPGVRDDYEDHAEASGAENPSELVNESIDHQAAVAETSSKEETKALRPWDYWPPGTKQYRQFVQNPIQLKRGIVREYEARVMIPCGTWRRPVKEYKHTDAFRPWLKLVSDSGGDAVQRLGNEITAFERYMTLDPNEVEAAKKVTAQVKRVITSSIDDGFCQVIGSHSTGLAMPWSDIDLAIVLPAIQEDAAAHHKSLTGRKYQKAYNKILLRLQRVFAQDFNFAGDSRHIYARVPIVRATHKRTNLEVQVQVQTDLGQQQQHVLAYMAEFPTLRPLYFVLRSCLELRHLHVTYEGGLGSYPILIMIVNALKHASGRFEPHDVANQLLHVLDFYAKCDLYHTGFSADPPRVFPKASVALTAEERMLRAADPVRRGIDSIAKPNRLEPYLLCLQDPADPNNDLGRKSYAIKHIQATFAMARETMLKAMRGWDRHRHLSLMNAMRGFLDPLVCANYRHFDIHRDKLKEYGDPESDGVGKWRIERPLKDLGDGEPKLSAREMLAKVIEVDNRKATAKKSQEEQTKIRENM